MGAPDIALRHVVHRRPEDLARPFLPQGSRFRVRGWIDTQLTHLERRLDKALRLDVDDERWALHIEFFLSFHADVPDRMFDYAADLSRSLRGEASSRGPRKRCKTKTSSPPVRIESVAVLLSGRERRWRRWGEHRTSSTKSRFSGARFRIDAVYQRTVAELYARGSLLWLVFTPLACDATLETMRDVVDALGAGAVDDEERKDLYAALFVLAKIDPWGHNLAQEIRTMIDATLHDGLMDTPMREWCAKYLAEKAREEVIQSLLGRLFMRRVGRRPRVLEKEALLERVEMMGAEEVEDELLDREGEALVRWLVGEKKVKGGKAKAAGKGSRNKGR